MYIVLIFFCLCLSKPFFAVEKNVRQSRFVSFNAEAFAFAEFNALEFTYYNPVFYHKAHKPLITARPRLRTVQKGSYE